MAMQYINYIRTKTHLASAPKSEAPILSEEDENFLNHITSQENPPVLPPRPDDPATAKLPPKDAQTALLDGAQDVPLPPETPSETVSEPALVTEPDKIVEDQAAAEQRTRKSKSTWSWLRRDSRDAHRQETAAGLQDVAAALKSPENQESPEDVTANVEVKKEEEEMTVVLEKLNLAAVNNRVFSISEETQELLRQFNLVFRDLMNGVPTAYGDLESLLTNGDRQLQKTFNNLPDFLQKLIERLPETMTKGIGPEIMAAAAERAQKSGFNMENAGKAASAASKIGFKTPSLKDLVGKPGAIAGMMRSTVEFLRARFPAFMGMNVLWSLALFGKQ